MSPQGTGPCAGRSGFRTRQAESWAREWIVKIASRSRPQLASRFVDTRLGVTHVLQTPGSSSGRDVVCLPPWGIPGAFWALSGGLAHLAEVGRIHLVDLPGQPGLSTGCALSYSGTSSAAWAEDLIDGLGLGQVDLMGVSAGGLIAVRVANHLRERVGRLVLCGPAGFVLPLPGPRPLMALSTYALAPTRDRCARFYRTCVLGPQRMPLDTESEAAEAFYRFSTGFANRSRPLLLLRDRHLREVPHETQLLLGDGDPVFSARRTLARARRLLPGLTEWSVLPSTGHALELSVDVMRAAGQFLAAY
jgi:pimeloyl-ACP methyl ester carboxylesterase